MKICIPLHKDIDVIIDEVFKLGNKKIYFLVDNIIGRKPELLSVYRLTLEEIKHYLDLNDDTMLLCIHELGSEKERYNEQTTEKSE